MNKLIDRYRPADYEDTFRRSIDASLGITAEYLFEKMFCDFPKPVQWLFNLRKAIVKPFGIQGGGSFKDLIAERNDQEIILSKKDSHLDFWVGIYCPEPSEGKQEASVTTVVKFNNFLGRLYFIGIWIFHKLLVRQLFTRAIKHSN